MVPKPDVEWVKKALERLNIRVVNDRPGRRRKDEVLDKNRNKRQETMQGTSMGAMDDQVYLSGMGRGDQGDNQMLFSSQNFNMGMGSNSNENSMNPMNSAYGGLSGGNSMLSSGGGMASNFQRRFSNDSGSGMGNFNPISSMGNNMPSNFDGGMGLNRFNSSMPSRNFGMNASGNAPGMESPGSSRQHYAILKEHHDNLLKELQQTTYMMQMYQRNYDQMEQENAGSNMNMVNNAMYGQNSNAGGVMGQRRPSLTFRQSQGRQFQGVNNSLQFQNDFPPRRNSLGIIDPQSQRQGLDGGYYPSGPSGPSGVSNASQNANLIYPDSDRMLPSNQPNMPASMANINRSSQRSNSRASSSDGNDQSKRLKVDHSGESGAGRSGSNMGFSAPKQEEV